MFSSETTADKLADLIADIKTASPSIRSAYRTTLLNLVVKADKDVARARIKDACSDLKEFVKLVQAGPRANTGT